MSLRRAFLIALVLCFATPSAFAQGMDDLLAPLTPSTKSKGKGKTTKRRPPKTSKAGKGSGKGSRQAPAPEPEASSGAADLLAPLVKKTELLVKLPGGPRGARLFVDDKDVGTLPRGALEVSPGEHTVAVRRPGYRDFSRRVTAKEGEVTEVGVLLDPVMGFVTVKADVAGARVIVDGEDKGTVPLEGLLLSAGSHEIVVKREGFRSETQNITVRAGKEYSVDANLRPVAVAQNDKPRAPVLTPSATTSPSPLTQEVPEVSSSAPLTRRWYFWAGVGAVVTAAAVGTMVATQPQPLDPHKDVCGGRCDTIINGPAATANGLRF
ncbi:PEGA domain-containing protein [Archangium sp.]|jgi:hypothetical protein|uniref:PEGA domain-containing protein n=1 Tax=Archangium sp. TaxID=1872627 RepID=UPI002ED83CF1